MLLPFLFTPAELFLLQWIKRRFCSDERSRWLAHIPSLCVATFCSMMHFSHARFSFFFWGCFVLFRVPAAICTHLSCCGKIWWLSVHTLETSVGWEVWKDGWSRCCFLLCPSRLTVCWNGVAGTCEGWQRESFWECGQTSQPRVPAAKKKKEQILNHYTLLHSYVVLQRFNG